MAELFGTDGIRGVAGLYPLDRPTIERIGRLLAIELTRRSGRAPRLIIGRDTRESGAWIEAALARGARAASAVLRFAGVITTPGVSYLTRALGADSGVVISASHNSYEDNGIKVFSTSGQKLDEDAEQAIEKDISNLKRGVRNGESLPNYPLPKIEIDASLREKYLTFLSAEVGAGLNLK